MERVGVLDLAGAGATDLFQQQQVAHMQVLEYTRVCLTRAHRSDIRIPQRGRGCPAREPATASVPGVESDFVVPGEEADLVAASDTTDDQVREQVFQNRPIGRGGTLMRRGDRDPAAGGLRAAFRLMRVDLIRQPDLTQDNIQVVQHLLDQRFEGLDRRVVQLLQHPHRDRIRQTLPERREAALNVIGHLLKECQGIFDIGRFQPRIEFRELAGFEVHQRQNLPLSEFDQRHRFRRIGVSRRQPGDEHDIRRVEFIPRGGIDVQERPRVAALVQPVIDQPGMPPHRDPLPGCAEVGFGGDGVLLIAEMVADIGKQLDQHHADIGDVPFPPVGHCDRQAVEEQPPQPTVVAG